LFKPIIKPESLSAHVEAELTSAIRNGKYRPLEKIPTEHELGALFQVSRTVIREAIRGLHAKGIVTVKKGSGVFVSEISIQNASEALNLFFGLSSDGDLMRHAIEFRIMIEPTIAGKSAKVRSEQHIARLQENLEELYRCPLDDKTKEAELDSAFHKILLESVNNPVLELLLDPIFNLVPKFKHEVFAKTIAGNIVEEKEKMLHYHHKITEAIVERQVVNAETLMREHLKVTLENYTNTK